MDNSLQTKIARMALTITTLKNKISTEKDFLKKMELNASLKRTIENFENAFLEDRLQKLKSKKKGGRKTNTRKNKTRKNKTRKNKTQKKKY
jgi:hypothetical protein